MALIDRSTLLLLSIYFLKGHTVLPYQAGKTRVIIDGLTNGFQYRFTIKSRNNDDISDHSKPSNTIIVDNPLPTWWFFAYDDESNKLYYINRRTRTISWERPDTNPNYLEEIILSNFKEYEISFLRELYDEVGSLI